MNYSSMLKEELAIIPSSEESMMAMLSAIIHTAGTLRINRDGISLVISSENSNLRELTASLTENLYNVSPFADSKRSIVYEGNETLKILLDTGILSYTDGYEAVAGISPFVVMDSESGLAYLRGAFLGAGSISTKTNYRAEISVSGSEFARDLTDLLANYGITAKTVLRKDRCAVYVKGSENVCDFCALLGGSKTVIKIIDLAMDRLSSQTANRQTNCDMANLDRTISVASMQIDAINRAGQLEGKLLEVADARITYPDFSYEQLAEVLHISKSAVKYRLNKIIEKANGKK